MQQTTPTHALNYWSDSNPLVSFRSYFVCQARKKMYKLFEEKIHLRGASDQVLDLGTTPDTKLLESNFFEQRYPYKQSLTIASIEDCSEVAKKFGLKKFVFNYPKKPLPFKDKEFDVLYCSAVIEHVGTRNDQKFFLKECFRVAHQCFITTPNRYFPIEMHSFIPFLHWLPWPIFQKILHFFGNDFLADINNLNLLSTKDISQMINDKYMKISFIHTLGWKSNIIITYDDTN